MPIRSVWHFFTARYTSIGTKENTSLSPANSFIRREVAERLHLRRPPELYFQLDRRETYAARIEKHRENKEYEDALLLLSTVRERLDTFFDKVMVMVDDEGVRANRLALLQTLLNEFSTIADFSEIVTEGKESKESQKQ